MKIFKTSERVRKIKRDHMARKRASNPDAARAYARKFHAENRERRCEAMRNYASKRFFWNREMHLHGSERAKAKQLAALWKKQRGLCALTGRRLDRTAHLDHISPIAKGGGDEIGNLRWLCNEANLAKRALSDEQFILLCSDCMAWIGKRIAMMDAKYAALTQAHALDLD